MLCPGGTEPGTFDIFMEARIKFPTSGHLKVAPPGKFFSTRGTSNFQWYLQQYMNLHFLLALLYIHSLLTQCFYKYQCCFTVDFKL